MSIIIKGENITFKYESESSDIDDLQALKGIDIEIEKGGFVSVLGHNGSGKSTLAKTFNGIIWPDEGQVRVLGLDTQDESNLLKIRQSVGMVFQNPDNQIVASIVEEDIAFGPENLGVEPAEIRKRVDNAMESVGITELALRSPAQLSGGQKQRVGIAGIIAMMPECIVLDEPTAMLDPQGRKEVMDTIKYLNKEHGITIILITHYMDEAAETEKIFVMNDGEIVLEGKPKDVFKKSDYLKSISLDIPHTKELVLKLRKHGIKNIDEDILTIDECVSALVNLLS